MRSIIDKLWNLEGSQFRIWKCLLIVLLLVFLLLPVFLVSNILVVTDLGRRTEELNAARLEQGPSVGGRVP